MRRRRRIHFFPILVDEEHLHLHLDKIFMVRLPSVPLFRLMILVGAMAAASQLVSCSLSYLLVNFKHVFDLFLPLQNFLLLP
jgi:hypothetical protein